jgi:hypothetical protein
MSRKEEVIVNGTEIGYHVFVDNGWYGDRYFYFLKVGNIGKTEAKNGYQSMVKKYLSNTLNRGTVGMLEILKNRDNQTTYIHSVGPSFYLNRIEIDKEKFEEFSKIEKERLEYNRKNKYQKIHKYADFKYLKYGY